MICVDVATPAETAWCQAMVTAHHYLHAPVDSRCAPLAYVVRVEAHDVDRNIGCLIFGRPEATRCYDGELTYGGRKDVEAGRARYDRWEVLNLARVWLHPSAQKGGELFERGYIPLFVDRRNVPRSTLASTVIQEALSRVGCDYLLARPPCFPDEPYQIRAVLSYCDTSCHKGTIYRASGFRLARTNERGIETYWTDAVAPLTSYQNDQVLKRAGHSFRSRMHRSRRQETATQEVLL